MNALILINEEVDEEDLLFALKAVEQLHSLSLHFFIDKYKEKPIKEVIPKDKLLFYPKVEGIPQSFQPLAKVQLILPEVDTLFAIGQSTFLIKQAIFQADFRRLPSYLLTPNSTIQLNNELTK